MVLCYPSCWPNDKRLVFHWWWGALLQGTSPASEKTAPFLDPILEIFGYLFLEDTDPGLSWPSKVLANSEIFAEVFKMPTSLALWTPSWHSGMRMSKAPNTCTMAETRMLMPGWVCFKSLWVWGLKVCGWSRRLREKWCLSRRPTELKIASHCSTKGDCSNRRAARGSLGP